MTTATHTLDPIMTARKVETVQRDIDTLTQQRQQWQARMLEIENAVADDLTGNTSKLESEYSKIALRLKASDKRLDSLQTELDQAHIKAQIEQYKALTDDLLQANTQRDTAQSKVDKLKVELEQAQSALDETQQQRQLIMARRSSVVHTIASQLDVANHEFESLMHSFAE